MMKKLEGRNWKHPGCAIGLTIGLIVGVVLAGVLSYRGIDFNVLLWIWGGTMFVLGLIGWIIGDRLSRPQLLSKEELAARANEQELQTQEVDLGQE